jgi:hypothetical protein
VIRGLFGSRVAVLADGLRLEDYSWSDEDAPSVDARLAERVEVIRGPASLLYGSDAVGGVVNVIPEPLPDASGRPIMRGGVETYFASGNLEGGVVARGEGAAGAFGWRATAIGRMGQDVHTPGGEIPNTGFGAVNGEAAVGVSRGWGTLALRYQRYGGEFKLLEADAPVGGGEEEEGGPERKLSDDRLQLSGTFPLPGVRIETRAQLQRHVLQEVADEVAIPVVIDDVSAQAAGAESVQFDLHPARGERPRSAFPGWRRGTTRAGRSCWCPTPASVPAGRSGCGRTTSGRCGCWPARGWTTARSPRTTFPRWTFPATTSGAGPRRRGTPARCWTWRGGWR